MSCWGKLEVNPLSSQLEIDPEQAQRSAPAASSDKTHALRNWALRISIAVLAPLLLLGLVEAGLRICGVGYSAALTIPCNVQGRPASCYNLFFAAPFFPPGMIKTPQVYAIPAVKPPQTFRIFVLGESAAMGDPDPSYSFSRYLEVMLRERYPEMKFEIVNTGSVAINSHVLLPIAKGLAKFKPDLFIIYSGNNEVVGPYGPGTALTAGGMSLPVIRGSIFYHSTRIGQLLTKLGTPKRDWGGMAMFMDKQVRANSPLMTYVYANYEQNLRDTIAVARRAGAKVIVSTVATNLLDCAPFASLHREGLSADDLRSWSALVEQGAAQENAASYAEALKLYQAAAGIDGDYAELEFRIARCLEALGDYSAARKHFLRARDLDTLRFRADTQINQINRSVALSSGVSLVDSAAIFAKESLYGIPGSDLVYEHVHLTPRGNYLLARAMFVEIANQLPAKPANSVQDKDVQGEDVPSEADCERWLAFTRHDRSRVAAEMLRRLQEPPFTNQLNHSAQVFRLMAPAEEPGENPNDTAAQYQWAIARSPDDRILHFNFGVFLEPYNPAAAEQQFAAARPFDGFPLVTPDGRIH
ncbi:MAG: tetratricopeptide repeat protein [Candidatus Sulfotelmatobacter sp.]